MSGFLGDLVPDGRFVVLLDLDDTLIPDRSAARTAVEQTLRTLGLSHDPAAVDRVFSIARAQWRSGPCYERLRDLGISSWEALWADLASPAVPLAAAWGLRYRAQVWTNVLRHGDRACEVDAADVCELFVHHRRALVRPFPGVVEVLDRFASHHDLWLVTNGASRLQRLKLELSGLGSRFQQVFVSAEIGFAKPHPRFFAAVTGELGPGDTVCAVVGDSVRAELVPALERRWPAIHVCHTTACLADHSGLTHTRHFGAASLPCTHSVGYPGACG